MKAKVEKFREYEKEGVNNVRQRQLELLEARKVTIDVVYAHKKVVMRLNEEQYTVSIDLRNVHATIHSGT